MLLTKKFLMVIPLIVAGLFLASCSSDSGIATGPRVVSLSPENNATAVKPNPILVITFDRKVYVEQGNITIKKKEDDSTVAVINVTGEQVEGSGTNIIIIYPVASIMSARGYYILIDGTAFVGEYGLYFAGINDPSTWNFSTVIATTPAGPKALIEVMAAERGMTAEEFWNTELFDAQEELDGFCKFGSAAGSELQKYYFDTFCTKKSENYFSYKKFIIADEKIQERMGDKYTFLRETGTDKKARIRNFCNFLATGAQETTSTEKDYTTDGYYYRYENGALGFCCSEAELTGDFAWVCQPNPYPEDPIKTPPVGGHCDPNGTYNYTMYTPGFAYKVALKKGTTREVWTEYAWGGIDDSGGGNKVDLTCSPTKVTWDNTPTAPDGYELALLNTVVDPYLWAGMGAIQLTADSVMYFFGWYYNHMVAEKPESADLNAFIRKLVTDGNLSFIGALWYWNYRVIANTNPPPIDKVLNYYEGKGAESPCHDIAISTYLVNGGCNHSKFRKKYYEYFTNTACQADIQKVKGTFDGVELDSFECTTNSAALNTYCTDSVFK